CLQTHRELRAGDDRIDSLIRTRSMPASARYPYAEIIRRSTECAFPDSEISSFIIRGHVEGESVIHPVCHTEIDKFMGAAREVFLGMLEDEPDFPVHFTAHT